MNPYMEHVAEDGITRVPRAVASRFVRAAEQMVLSYLRQLQADSSRRGVSREDTRHAMAWRPGVVWRNEDLGS